MKLISFRLGGEWFAMYASIGLKIVRHAGITPLAASPAYVAGIAGINGQVVTVLLLERILRLPQDACGEDRRCIILKPEKGEEQLTGFMVESPVDIIQCNPEDVKTPFQVKENAVTPYINGLLSYQGEVLRVLDIEGILAIKRGDKA